MSEFQYCTGICGVEEPHTLFNCTYAKYWEQLDNGDGTFLTWIHKLCLPCCAYQFHSLSANGSSFTCMECYYNDHNQGFRYIASKQAFKQSQLIKLMRLKDSKLRSDLAFNSGYQLLIDSTCTNPKAKPHPLQNFKWYHLKNCPLFVKSSMHEKWYKLDRRYIPESMFPVFWDVFESIEKKNEEENTFAMFNEDIKGNFKYQNHAQFNDVLALLHTYGIYMQDITYQNVNAFINGQWVHCLQDSVGFIPAPATINISNKRLRMKFN